MASVKDWRIAYAKQASADLSAREQLLQSRDLPECQQLHFLQMACEKLCKAHLCGQGTDPMSLQSSHAYIENVLPIIVRQQIATQTRHQPKNSAWVISQVKRLSREIELLNPAVKGGGAHPANCEYPWIGPDGNLRVPAEHNFRLNLLYEPAGTFLLKAMYAELDDLISGD